MDYKTLNGLLALLIMGMSLIVGCTNAPVPPGIPDTTAPQAVTVTVPVTLAISVQATTLKVQPSRIQVPAPVVSATCRDLLLAAADDAAFLRAMKDNGVYSGIYNLGYFDCNLRSASRVNREIATSPQPETPLLIQVRQDMISAAQHCYDPSNSEAQARTNEDLDRSMENMAAYGSLVSSCIGQIDENISASLKIPITDQGGTLLHGGGDDVQSFTAGSSGARVFTLSYSGNGKFTAWLKDSQGKKIDLLADAIGSYDGKKLLSLGPGNYFVDVTASGPWTISVTTL